jgi:hypothetical protein
VVTNGTNVVEKIGKVLIVAKKENVNICTNGILNVKVMKVVIIVVVTQLLQDVVINGLNAVEKAGKVLNVV